MVRTRVQQIWKLRIQLQPSGRLPIMVWTRAQQIWKLRVEDQPSRRQPPSPDVETLIRKLLATDVQPFGRCVISSGRGSRTGKIFLQNLRNFGRTVVRPDGHDHRPDDSHLYQSSRPFEPSAYK